MSNKFFFFTLGIAIAISMLTMSTAYSQVYQFENPGFEQWDGGSADEPTGWNSFPSANCTITIGCATAKAKKHERSTEVRPGSNGQYSCCIYSKSVLGVVANGALTSGQMELASINMSNPNNGNRTKTGNNDFNHRLNAKPDSIVFWAKTVNASNTSKACCHLYIHDNYDLKDPLSGNSAGYESHIVGKVPSYDFTNQGSTWRRHAVAIDYTNCPSNDPQFILITFSTNVNAGGGSDGDKLFIDDIELIYNANLASITVNGANIPNFNPNVTDYYVDVECGATNYISAITASPRAEQTTVIAPDGNSANIKVKHGDKEKTYTIHYHQVVKTTISDDICQGDTYSSNGFALPMQNNSGNFIFTNNFQNPNGCDSLAELSLNVHSIFTTNIDQTICETATYDFFGTTLNQAGTYTQILTSQHGCDSTIILNLLVDNYFQTNLTAQICEGEEYNENGFDRLNQAGYDTLRLVATNHCDSIVVLRLEVGINYNIELFDSIEIESEYNNNGFILSDNNAEGEFIYTETYISQTGCDSIVTLHLKVLPKPEEPSYEVPDYIDFEIYPIPATGSEATIIANYEIKFESYKYKIFNELGKFMSEGEINSRKTKIDISKFETGYYYLKVFYDDPVADKRKVKKFFVSN